MSFLDGLHQRQTGAAAAKQHDAPYTQFQQQQQPVGSPMYNPAYPPTNAMRMCCDFLYWLTVIMAALGTAAFIMTLIYNHNVNNELTAIKNTLDLQSVEILELQTLTNQTGDGVNVETVPGFFALTPGPIVFGAEAWDDADFWSPAPFPSRIYIPRDARYAIGWHCTDLNGPFTSSQTVYINGPPPAVGPTDVCKFSFTFALNFPSAIAGYCEVELVVGDGNWLEMTSDHINAPDPFLCRLTVRQIGPLTGSSPLAPDPGP